LVGALFKWNFPIWAAQRVAPSMMLTWVAVPQSLVPSLEPPDRAALDEAIKMIFPVNARHDGMVYDARSQSGAFGLFPIQQISAPTMWVSADDDLYNTARVARFAASVVPGAKLLVYETGGHLLLGRGRELWPAVAEFLRD
jgi:pimeloyl-ACP methyl ester carboxylesterase